MAARRPGRASAEAFAEWYAREAPILCQTVHVALGDRALAEEVTAEAFARAWARWRRVSAMSSPEGWVYRVALNHARSGFRRRRLERRLAATPAPIGEPPADPDDALRAAVANLAPRARLALGLRYLADLPEVEVAELMGVTRGTVAATLHSARRQLASILQREKEEVAS